MLVPESVSDEAALLLGDVLPTGYFCAFQSEVHRSPFDGLEYGVKSEVDSEQIEKTNSVAVIGCGPVGLMAVLSMACFALWLTLEVQ